MSDNLKIVIIGGGIAGLSAAQGVREITKTADIKLICAENRLPYYRPRICEVFSGLDPDKLVVKNAQWFTDNAIETVFATVTAIDADGKFVLTGGGERIEYDRLIIATGANGNLPKVPGSDAENVLAMRYLKDTDRVRRFPGAVVIIGGGLLGLEAAWHLSREGRPVTVVDRGGHLLSRQLDPEAGAFFKKVAEDAGVRIVLDGNLEHIDGKQVFLEGGTVLDANVVLFAAGIKPEVSLGVTLGLSVNRAIVVDEKMQTSMEDVYACGDCAELNGINQGLWTVSMAQGPVAGKNAAGGDAVYKPEPPSYTMNAMGTRIWSLGDIGTSDAVSSQGGSDFKKLFFDTNGKLAGAIMIGSITKASALKKAISEKVPKEEALRI
ncbi:MAG: NAD(P)/FAD-dependent oxidoreductase [Clostridiales bacterium]|nr:NAD(P)/FAD-dependent oxidoreductase [Clostridiales bacterium]